MKTLEYALHALDGIQHVINLLSTYPPDLSHLSKTSPLRLKDTSLVRRSGAPDNAQHIVTSKKNTDLLAKLALT